jgi:hypothetical protein
MAEAGINDKDTKTIGFGADGVLSCRLKNDGYAFRKPENETLSLPRVVSRARRRCPDRCRRPSSPFGDGMRRGVFSEMALLKIIL